MNQNKGATQADWDNLSLLEGLTVDLLPVVSDPDVTISPNSKMKFLGKTPSVINYKGHVAGFANWTEFQATHDDVAGWSKEPRYGICIQTRNVRAFDIDVDDQALAAQYESFLGKELERLGKAPVAQRTRGNSGKCLLAFVCRGDLQKRVVKVDGGMVEFLATGQQFIAYGTHPSGSRYEWNGYASITAVEITVDELNELWQSFVDKFAISPPSERTKRQRGEDVDMEDPIIDQLDILSWSSDGKKAYITCPFEHEHSVESSESSTCYMPAGTEGYMEGHFKCLHASCEGRPDYEFQDALGITIDCGFEPLDDDDDLPASDVPMLERDSLGRVLPIAANVEAVLSDSELTGWEIRKDVFKEEIIVNNKEGWRPLQDEDFFSLKLHLEKHGHFKPIAERLMRDAVRYVARKNQVDSAKLWIADMKWDGVPRIETFLIDYMGVEDTPYSRAVALYAWSAMAGRVLQPGVKADMTPILIGEQGAQKSTGIEAMAPSSDYFVEVSMGDSEDDRIRRTKGRLVGEFGEMRGLYSAALESVKAYLVRTHDVWVPKYQEQPVSYARRIFYWGTSNHYELFTDLTGNRRWLPVVVKMVDRAGIEAIREQLWAEAAVLFKQNGVMYQEAERLGLHEHKKYMIEDPRMTAIETWLHKPCGVDGTAPLDKGYITTAEILELALGYNRGASNSGHGKQVSETMRALKFDKIRKWIDGRYIHVWVPRGELLADKRKADDLL